MHPKILYIVARFSQFLYTHIVDLDKVRNLQAFLYCRRNPSYAVAVPRAARRKNFPNRNFVSFKRVSLLFNDRFEDESTGT